MRPTRISPVVTTLAAIVGLTAGLAGPWFASSAVAAEVSEFGTPNQEYLEQKAELEKLVATRDTDLYELGVEPLDFDEVVIKDKLGRNHVFNYLTLRLRNEIKDVTRPAMAKPSRYNEVIKTIAEQYEFAKAGEEGSGKLTVATAVPAEGVVLERQDLKPRTRSVNITVIAYNQNGSRIQLLDEPVGSGSQNTYNFPDYGELSRDEVIKRAREEAEEKADRRLHTVDEIRAMKLPPYDAKKVDEEGVAEGEVYAVVLFDRLSVYGDKFTVEVRGLSNKFRTRQPDTKKGEVDNYVAARFLRRVFTLHYSRPGDEYFRNLDRFTLEKGGWEWVNTFERLKQRKSVAYAKYFLTNITDDKNVRQPKVEDELWEYYSGARTEFPNAGDKLPDLKATLKERPDSK